jgi:hypothetical protein
MVWKKEGVQGGRITPNASEKLLLPAFWFLPPELPELLELLELLNSYTP